MDLQYRNQNAIAFKSVINFLLDFLHFLFLNSAMKKALH